MFSYAENTKLDRANKPTLTLYLVFLLSTKWNKTCTYVYTRNSKFKTNWKMVERLSFFAKEKSCLAWAMSEPELLPEWWTGLSYYPGTPIVAEESCWFILCLPIIHSRGFWGLTMKFILWQLTNARAYMLFLWPVWIITRVVGPAEVIIPAHQ